MSELAKLTPRETEILAQIGQGRTSRQIAEQLTLSVFTINNHRKHICQKLRLHSTAELVAYAVRSFPNGLSLAGPEGAI
jgi:DNA-binding CsgD family transcriptional regulator